MEIRETIISSLNNIRMSKMRSVLTMLGIIIGIGAVILISSIGAGQTRLFEKAFGKMGNKTLTIGMNNNYSGKKPIPWKVIGLTSQDIQFIKTNPNIKYISPMQELTGNSNNIHGIQVTDPICNTGATLIAFNGIQPDYFDILGMQFINGRCFSNNTKLPYIVIGDQFAKVLFKNKNSIGKSITFNFDLYTNGIYGEYTFKIVGVVKNPYAEVSKSADSYNYLAYVPAYWFLKITGQSRFLFAWVTVKEKANLKIVQNQIVTTLAKIKNLPKAMYVASPVNKWVSNQANQMKKQNIFIILIASISLLVGGIGIMNIMLVTVSERTKEIGIRKAIGATNINILIQFLIEAVILTVMGGIIGIIVGYIGSLITGDVIGIPPVLNWGMVVFAFLISVGIGIVFGVIPARKAAKMNPIDALRHD